MFTQIAIASGRTRVVQNIASDFQPMDSDMAPPIGPLTAAKTQPQIASVLVRFGVAGVA